MLMKEQVEREPLVAILMEAHVARARAREGGREGEIERERERERERGAAGVSLPHPFYRLNYAYLFMLSPLEY
jgi:hypothetical protein